jgi:hypothetical protein
MLVPGPWSRRQECVGGGYEPPGGPKLLQAVAQPDWEGLLLLPGTRGGALRVFPRRW